MLQVYVDRGVTDEGVEIAGITLNVGGSIEAALTVITAVTTGKLARKRAAPGLGGQQRLLSRRWARRSQLRHQSRPCLGKQACPSRRPMPVPPAEGLRLSWCGESYVSIRLFERR